MPASTTSSVFPDVNVWLALTYERHVHNAVASAWLAALDPTARVCFCRLTQLGLLRLLTSAAVMEPARLCTQVGAWAQFDTWAADDRVEFRPEPERLDSAFRALSHNSQASPKAWADSYLAAFAQCSGLKLVTFDRALSRRAPGTVLLA